MSLLVCSKCILHSGILNLHLPLFYFGVFELSGICPPVILWLNMVFAEECISVSVVFLVNGLLVLSSSPSTGNTNIIASVPGEIKAFPCTCSHVISEWAGFVSSWALDLPRKAPSVLFLARCFRAVGGGIRVKINKIKKERNSSSKPWGLMESEGSLLWMKIHLHLCQCQGCLHGTWQIEVPRVP